MGGRCHLRNAGKHQLHGQTEIYESTIYPHRRGNFLSWLVSDRENEGSTDINVDAESGNFDPSDNHPEEITEEKPVSQPLTLEVLREIFENGKRPLKRRDAVKLLKGAPYFIPKTNAYRALVPSRRFAANLKNNEKNWLVFIPEEIDKRDVKKL